MEFSIDTNNVLLEQHDQVESGEYNVTECTFNFSNEYNGLTKKAVFTGEDGTAYLQTIVDNKCSIPSEILEVSQVVEIGVYAYDVDNEELLLRYSPRPTEFYVHEGSYKEGQNSTPPTPSEIEQLQAQITTNANNIEELTGDVVDINQDIADIKAEQITQNENIQTNTDNISTINGQIITINADIDNLERTKADKSEIPTKTSDLINDSDFVSDSDYVHTDNNFTDEDKTQITTNKNDIATLQSTKADKSEIPTKTSQLNNDSGFITKNVDDLANYYKKSETYNKTEIDGKVSSVYKYKGTVATYQDLPSTDLTIGDVYNVEEDGSNYAWTGNSWDKLGGDIDLSEYYTKTQTDSLLSAKANSSDVYTKNETYNKTEVNTLLDGKVDKVQGKGLSSNDFTDNDKNQIEANQTAITNIKDGTTIDSFGDVETALNGKEDVSNKVTSISSSSTDTQYPSAKCVYDSQEEQDTEIEALQQENAELKQDISNMAKAMYKVDGQGSDITLPNTSENKFVEFELEGRTEQEQLSGKNLLNVPSTFELNRFREFLISLEAGSYILSLENWATSGSNGSSVFNIDGTAYSLNNTNKSVNVTINNDINNIYMYSYYDYNSSAGITATFTNLMIRKASVTDTSYEPYCGGIPSPNPDFPQQIKNVTGNAKVKIQNKNLFDKNGEILNAYIFHTIIANSDNRVIIIPIKPNTQYNLSGTQISSSQDDWYMLLCEEKPIIGSTGREINISTAPYFSVNFTSGNNENWIALKFANIKKTEVEETLKTIQLEEGTTATAYVPHQEQNLPFTFAEGQRLMQGGKLKDGRIYNKWKQYALPYNSALITGTLFGVQCKFASYDLLNAKNEARSYKFYANKLSPANEQFRKYSAYRNQQSLIVMTDIDDTVENFNANVAGTIVEYELETPETIPYNSTQQEQYNDIEANATSYDDITYMSSESDELGFDMNVVAVADANKVIDSELQEIKSAVIALGGDLNV